MPSRRARIRAHAVSSAAGLEGAGVHVNIEPPVRLLVAIRIGRIVVDVAFPAPFRSLRRGFENGFGHFFSGGQSVISAELVMDATVDAAPADLLRTFPQAGVAADMAGD